MGAILADGQGSGKAVDGDKAVGGANGGFFGSEHGILVGCARLEATGAVHRLVGLPRYV